MISTLATVRVTGSDHGGTFRPHQPRIIVAHSVEAPIKRGQAKFRMELLAGRKDASAHYLVDPGTIAAGVEEEYVAWGAGSVNPAAIHVEFMGYAAYTRAQWTTDDGLSMLKLGGKLIADIAKRRGIPVRWLTDAQLLAAWKGQCPGGLTTHAQCTRVIGGTTHTDPGPNFPTDLLLEYASPKPTKPATQTVQEDDDMKPDEPIDLSDAYYPTLTPPRPAARKGVSYKKAFADLFNYVSTDVRDGKLALDQLKAISKQLDDLPAKIATAIKEATK